MTKKESRKYNSELRERQKELTKDMIMESLCSLILDGKIHDFNLQDVADRAGVSYGSVYKHFPSKESLFEALYEWGENLQLAIKLEPPESLYDLPDFNAVLFSRFEEHAELRFALLQAMIALNLKPENMRKRPDLYLSLIRRAFPNLDEEQAKRAARVIHYLSGSTYWMLSRKRDGLDLSETIASMKWALEALIEDLKRRNKQDGSDEANKDHGGES